MSRSIKLSDELITAAAATGKALHRSTPRQIEYWAQIGKIAEENPELPLGLVKDILVSQEEASVGDVTDYDFG
ncbi:MAG: hypothetical protein HOF19_09220 [Gammaproteobacteria bacterium]|nr:hypothetical protein [Gammaproteobacteria bacterium]